MAALAALISEVEPSVIRRSSTKIAIISPGLVKTLKSVFNGEIP